MVRRISALAMSVFSDALRRRVLYAIGLFAGALAFGIPSLPNYGLGVAAALFREVALALTFLGATILTLVLSSNRIPSEVERRTVYSILVRPVSRWEYVVGTWLGIVTVIGTAIGVFTVVEQVVGVLQYSDPMWRLWEGALAIWLETGVIAAFCVAVSGVAGPVVVSVSAVAFLFVAHSRSGLFGADATGLLPALYPSLDMFNVINPVAHGTGVGAAYVGGMLAAYLGWVVALLVLGALGFSRRDL